MMMDFNLINNGGTMSLADQLNKYNVKPIHKSTQKVSLEIHPGDTSKLCDKNMIVTDSGFITLLNLLNAVTTKLDEHPHNGLNEFVPMVVDRNSNKAWWDTTDHRWHDCL